mgnify:CR=1 FL=1
MNDESKEQILTALQNKDQDAFGEAIRPVLAKRVETVLKMRKIDKTQEILNQ